MGSRSKARARAKASQSADQRAQATRKPAIAGASAGAATAATQVGRASAERRAGQPGAAAPGRPSAVQPAEAQLVMEPGGPTPRTVLGLALIELIEAAGILLASILAGVATGTGKSYQLASGIAITVIGVAVALGLALVARGLRSGRRWTRTPTLLTQLFAGIVGIYLTQSGRYQWGIPALVLAVAGFGLLLAPASVRLLTPGRAEPPAPR